MMSATNIAEFRRPGVIESPAAAEKVGYSDGGPPRGGGMEGRIGKLEGEMAGVARFQSLYVPLTALVVAVSLGGTTLLATQFNSRFTWIDNRLDKVEVRLDRVEVKLDEQSKDIAVLKTDVAAVKTDVAAVKSILDEVIRQLVDIKRQITPPSDPATPAPK
jgi:uncharacterized coiled-coil protein SlyX